MKRIAIAALLSVCVAAPAVAAEATYVGVKAGRSNNNAPGLTEKRDTAYSILAGVKFNPNVAFELAYSDLGNNRSAPNVMKLSEWDGSFVGMLPLKDRFSLNGKLGLAWTKTEQSVGGTGKRTGATYGINVQYDINPSFAVRFGWDRYGMKNAAQVKSDADVWSLTGLVNF